MSERMPEFYTEGVQGNVLNFDVWRQIVIAKRRQFELRRGVFYPRPEPEIPPIKPYTVPPPQLKLIEGSPDPSLGISEDGA